ncbi:MAG: CDP-diacylglycerol--glycerol-3-phosphate 3-phosphatidyltransferase [Phycisphaerae bacterium]|nr:CDP-diacylglycerol--glycerol-3-phosphate 3-phosphatidyltransferase [Phycisphaerae bacterium]
MAINLPNQITLGRLVLATILFVCLAQYDHGQSSLRMLDWAAALFIVAALTDMLDGYLARRQNQVTSFGRVLDPFVDKVLVCGSFLFLCAPGFVDDATGRNVSDVSAWMVVLIIGRELLVTSLRGFSEAQGDSFGANVFGKAKMMVQSITIPVILIFQAHPDGVFASPKVRWIQPALVWLTVIVTTASMGSYLLRARNILSELSRPTDRDKKP